MNAPIILTDLQRALLAYLRFQPLSTESEILAKGRVNEEALKEARTTLENNGFIRPEYERGDWRYTLTDAGIAKIGAPLSSASWIHVPTCPACVQVNCVCSIRIKCLNDVDFHSLGCHGSHE